MSIPGVTTVSAVVCMPCAHRARLLPSLTRSLCSDDLPEPGRPIVLARIQPAVQPLFEEGARNSRDGTIRPGDNPLLRLDQRV